jgi:hypothetical protein
MGGQSDRQVRLLKAAAALVEVEVEVGSKV